MDQAEVIFILKNHSGQKDISMSNSLVDDLGINGDDADELYFDLLDNHQIDLKKMSHIEECFHTEGELIDPFFLVKQLANKIGLSKKPVRRELKQLKVSEIVDFCAEQSKNA